MSLGDAAKADPTRNQFCIEGMARFHSPAPHPWRRARLAAAILGTALSASSARAQPTAAIEDWHPTAHVNRIAASEAPILDGDLSDPSWAKATALEELRQRQPNDGARPTERTIVRIMYDDNNLYFGVYAFDSEPDKVLVRSMARDGAEGAGDNINIILDP